jgi:hypothetical protein
MEEIKQNVRELQESWKKIYEAASSSENSWRPHLPYSSLEELTEVVSTIATMLDRVRAPTGFSPGYHLAKGLAATSLPAILTSAKNIEAGQYNHFPTFVNGISKLLSTIHSMVIFSPYDEKSEIVTNISVQLSQGIAVLNTAQNELHKKVELIEKAQSLIDNIETKSSEIENLNTKAVSDTISIQNGKELASKELIEIQENNSEIQDIIKRLNQSVLENEKFKENLNSQAVIIEKIQAKSEEQQQVIDSVLPKGASAGLAAAFASRGAQLQPSKNIWMAVFILSILALATFSLYLVSHAPNDPNNFWQSILYKIPLAAPFIWLGWFSAIQYGNIVRVQEDYAFKEATSKAFAGYRDHMEHIASVELEGAMSAMNLLAAKTIEILAHEPLRIFNKTERDATPTHGILSLLGSLRGQKPDKTA